MPRVKMDWTKHQLNIKKGEFASIHELRKGDSKTERVVFTNIEDHLVVTGDYGQWVFTRNLHPFAGKELLSDHYWVGNLNTSFNDNKIGSEYSPELTSESIDESINDIVEELKEYFNTEAIDYPGDDLLGFIDSKEWDDEFIEKKMEEVEFFNYIQEHVTDELDYVYRAYRENPSSLDYEAIPFCREIIPQIKIIFDAFEEICRRLLEQQINF